MGRASKQSLWSRVQETRKPGGQKSKKSKTKPAVCQTPDSRLVAILLDTGLCCAAFATLLPSPLGSLFQHKAAVCDMQIGRTTLRPPSLRPKQPSHLEHSKPRVVWHGPGTSCPLLTASERVLRHYGSGFQYVLHCPIVYRSTLPSTSQVPTSQHAALRYYVIAAETNSLLQRPRTWHRSRRLRMLEMFLLISTIPAPQTEPERQRPRPTLVSHTLLS